MYSQGPKWTPIVPAQCKSRTVPPREDGEPPRRAGRPAKLGKKKVQSIINIFEHLELHYFAILGIDLLNRMCNDVNAFVSISCIA